MSMAAAAGLTAGLLGLMGCKSADRVADAVTNAGDSINAAGQNVADAGKSVKEGLDAFARVDPLGLNQVLNDNRELRGQVEALQRKLLGASGGLVPVDRASEVWFEITDYRGRVRLSAWVDSRENRFLQDIEPPEKNPTLDLSPRLIRDWMARVGSETHPPIGGGPLVGGPGGDILPPYLVEFGKRLWAQREQKDREIVAAANAALARYLSARGVPTQGFARTRIDFRFVTSAPHRVFVDVEPIAFDNTGKWGVDWRFVVRRADGTTHAFHHGSVSSDNNDYKAVEFGESIVVDAGGFVARISTE